VLQVTDAVSGVVRVRMMVSAPNAGALFDLRCTVREGMVRWVHLKGGVVPTQRIEPAVARPEPEQPRTGHDRGTTRVASGLFSGSPEAEERGRAFDEHSDFDDDLASSNGRSNESG
jgi:hypothetical protein